MLGFKIKKTSVTLDLILGVIIVGGVYRVASRPIPMPSLIISAHAYG